MAFPSWSWAAWEAVDENVEGHRIIHPGGVRYEPHFQVQTDGGGRLQKVLPDGKGDPEERMRPMLKWYVVDRSPRRDTLPSSLLPPRQAVSKPPLPPRRGTTPIFSPSPRSDSLLRPLNKTGLGLAFAPEVDITDWNGSVRDATNNLDQSVPSLPAHIVRHLTEQHLVFRTRVAQFYLGETRTRTKIIWKRDQDATATGTSNSNIKPMVHSQLKIRETAILDRHGAEVGRCILPDPDARRAAQQPHDFVFVSEAQFFGDERCVDVGGYPLFNVMLLRWSAADGALGRPFASRVAMGRVTKEAFWSATYSEEVVVLG